MEQSPYQLVVDATADDYRKHILCNPLLDKLQKGAVTVQHYASYLLETFHLVRHTSRALALAASRTEDSQRGLRAWLLEQANEEHGHELFCVKDLKHFGYSYDDIAGREPGLGAWSMVTQNYYLATHGNPVGILGVASATEQMGSELAGALSSVVASRLQVDSNALTFLRSHSSFDVKHLEEVKNAINEFATTDIVRRQVILARRYTLRHYGQLFLDVASQGGSNLRAEQPIAIAA